MTIQVVVSGYPGYQPAGSFCVYSYTHIQRDRLWYLGIQGISLLGLSMCIYIHVHGETGCGFWVSRVSTFWIFLCVSIYTHTEKHVVVSGYPGYQSAGSFCIHLYTHTERQAVVSGYPGYQSAVLSVYISTHIQRNKLWYLGRVSRVSACCPLHIYLYTHTEKQVVVSGYLWYQPAVLSVYIYTHNTEKQVVVSGYPGYQPAGSFCVSIYTHTEKQAVVSGYPGYQPAVLSIYIYKRKIRNRLWYLGIQGMSLLGIYLYTHTEKQVVVSGPGIQGISLLSSPYISLHTYRETGCGI